MFERDFSHQRVQNTHLLRKLSDMKILISSLHILSEDLSVDEEQNSLVDSEVHLDLNHLKADKREYPAATKKRKLSYSRNSDSKIVVPAIQPWYSEIDSQKKRTIVI